MNSFCIRSIKGLAFAGLFCVLGGPLLAWEPNAKELDGAINSGDFTSYFANLSGWLGQKAHGDPAKLTHPVLTA
ncbi:MAG: hypothetical protein WCJ66_12385, partial [Verrucomicrobiota bacterium]